MEDRRFELVKCVFCGKAFAQEAGKRPTCPDCLAEEDAIYRKIRNLVSNNPDRRMNVSDVAKLLDIEERKINYLIENGMFNLTLRYGQISWPQGD
ncbi:MAG: hypothetical protein LBF92_08305 [Synergistaceae bacterium]|jgi:hypothetical protein|nr:hypothetical protein [Synergistaceae bacterium]